MFLLDIQKAQADGVRAFLARPGARRRRVSADPGAARRASSASPGSETNLDGAEDVRARGPLARPRVHRSRIAIIWKPNERVVAGAFWNGPSAEPEVSVEKRPPNAARLHVGDTMRFDMLGRDDQRAVTSIRDVEWRESRNGGFVFVFRPGALDQAPQTFVAPLKGPERRGGAGAFQHDLVERFPNVSVIDFHEVLETVRDVMSKVTLAITVVGGLVLFSGGLILIGAVAMTKFQRVYEAAVFKTLGANTRHDRAHAAVRVRRARIAGGPDRLARRHRADLGRQPLRARDPLARVPLRAHRRRRADRAARRA